MVIGLSDYKCFSWLKTAYSARNGAPSCKGRGAVSTRVCAKKERNGPAGAGQSFLKLARQPPCARHVMTMPANLPYPIFLLLVQNLSSKQIAPTDNMRPKFHDEYTRHQWLKGENIYFFDY